MAKQRIRFTESQLQYGLSKYGTVMKLKEGKDLDSIIRRVIREEVEKSKDIEWWEYSKPDEGWDPSFYGHVNDKKNLEKEHKYYMEYAKFEPNPSMENFEYKKMQKLLKNYDGRAIHLSLM